MRGHDERSGSSSSRMRVLSLPHKNKMTAVCRLASNFDWVREHKLRGGLEYDKIANTYRKEGFNQHMLQEKTNYCSVILCVQDE